MLGRSIEQIISNFDPILEVVNQNRSLLGETMGKNVPKTLHSIQTGESSSINQDLRSENKQKTIKGELEHLLDIVLRSLNSRAFANDQVIQVNGLIHYFLLMLLIFYTSILVLVDVSLQVAIEKKREREISKFNS